MPQNDNDSEGGGGCGIILLFIGLIIMAVWMISDSDYSDLSDDRTSLNITCTDIYGCNDDIIDINSEIFWLQCVGDNSCSNLTINGENASQVSIKCIGYNSCSNLNVNAEYVSEFEFWCNIGDNIDFNNNSNSTIVSFVCDEIIINAQKSKSVDIICTEYGCSDINIFATNAIEINVNAKGQNAFIYSTIYAQKAEKLDISCFSPLFEGETCLNSNIYLSSFTKSNTLQCRFGCDEINLYFENNIDLSLFDSLSFMECSLCSSIDQCINQWIIYYGDNYNSSFIFDGIHHENESQINQFTDYIEAQYWCPASSVIETQLENDLFLQISMVLFILSILLIGMLLFHLIIYLIIIFYKKCKRFYISPKPSLFILFYSICIEFMVFVLVNWCWIKLTIFYGVTEEYCSSKYQYAEDKEYCIDNKYCDYYDNKCNPNQLIFSMSLTVWIIWSILFILELVGIILIRICCSHWTYCDCVWIYMYCKLMNNDELYNKRYLDRQFWTDRQKSDLLIQYFLSQMTRYLPLLLLIGIIIDVNYIDGDYLIEWSEYLLILVLIIIKIILQINYTFARKYRLRDEIEWILTNECGEDIGLIIKQFMPLFYEKKKDDMIHPFENDADNHLLRLNMD